MDLALPEGPPAGWIYRRQQQGLAGTSAGSGSTGVKGYIYLPGRLVHVAKAEDA